MRDDEGTVIGSGESAREEDTGCQAHSDNAYDYPAPEVQAVRVVATSSSVSAMASSPAIFRSSAYSTSLRPFTRMPWSYTMWPPNHAETRSPAVPRAERARHRPLGASSLRRIAR